MNLTALTILSLTIFTFTLGCIDLSDACIAKKMDRQASWNERHTAPHPVLPKDFTGVWEEQWNSGFTKVKKTYKNGVAEGYCIFYDYKTGKPTDAGHYKNGNWNGPWKSWDKNGHMTWRNFIDGFWYGTPTEQQIIDTWGTSQ